MAFNAYDKRAIAQYTPLTMQEVLLPAQIQREREDKIMEQYMATESELNKMDYLMEKESDDSVMKQQFMSYKNQLQDASNDLLENGVNNTSMRRMMQFRADFPLIYSSISKAEEARQATTKTAFQIKAQDPSAIVEDVSQLSLDDFRNNNYQPVSVRSVSVDAIAKDASNIYNQLSKLLMSENSVDDYVVNGLFNDEGMGLIKKTYLQYGLDVQDIKEDREGLLEDIKWKLYKKYGVVDSNDQIADYINVEDASRLDGALEGSMFFSLGTTQIQNTQNPLPNFYSRMYKGRNSETGGFTSIQAQTGIPVTVDLNDIQDYTDTKQLGKDVSNKIILTPPQSLAVAKINKNEDLNDSDIKELISFAKTEQVRELSPKLYRYVTLYEANSINPETVKSNTNILNSLGTDGVSIPGNTARNNLSKEYNINNLAKVFREELYKNVDYSDNLMQEMPSALNMNPSTFNDLYNKVYKPEKDEKGNTIPIKFDMKIYPIGSLDSSNSVTSSKLFNLNNARKIGKNGQLTGDVLKKTAEDLNDKNVYFYHGNYVVRDGEDFYMIDADNDKQSHFKNIWTNMFDETVSNPNNVLSSSKTKKENIKVYKDTDNTFNFNIKGSTYKVPYSQFSQLAKGTDINGNTINTSEVATNLVNNLVRRGLNINKYLIGKVDDSNDIQAFKIVIPFKQKNNRLDISNGNSPNNNNYIIIKGVRATKNGNATYSAFSTSTLKSRRANKVDAFNFSNSLFTNIGQGLGLAYGKLNQKQVEGLEN